MKPEYIKSWSVKCNSPQDVILEISLLNISLNLGIFILVKIVCILYYTDKMANFEQTIYT